MTRPDLFDHGTTVQLNAVQRNYVARKLLESLASARRNRDRIAAKYPEHGTTATRPMDSAIHSLNDLGRKIGLTDKELNA